MSNKLKRPADGQVGQGDKANGPNRTQSNGNTPRRPIKHGTKLYRVLEALANGDSLNRFEAVRNLHDWCLHSTVSAIQKYGIRVDRKTEAVGNFLDKHTWCCRYWLDAEQRKKARDLLGS